MQLTIISGGQTGADRGGLEAALELGIPHGGFCPKGRRAEDGIIPPQFCLTETPSTSYIPRTRANILTSDATILFAYGGVIKGGSRMTYDLCVRIKKPVLVIVLHQGLSDSDAAPAQTIRGKVETLYAYCKRPITLNIAGSRESKAPGIQARVKGILVAALR
jgi:hypothetical protein